MQEKYAVTYGGQTVGTVELKREGLYYRVFCCCRMCDNEIHRLYADGEKIGVLMPDGESLILEAKVAAKRLKEGCTFSLEENRGEFVPIRSGEKFPHLDRVRQGRLSFRDGEPGVFVPV